MDRDKLIALLKKHHTAFSAMLNVYNHLPFNNSIKGKVKLSWSKVSNAKGYKIYVKEPGSSKYRCRITRKSSVRSVTHKGLKRGKTYRYKMRAYKITNGTTEYGPYSEVRTVKIK